MKRELREKETAMNSLAEKTADITDKLKREKVAKEELMKKLAKHTQQQTEAVKKKDTSSTADEKVGLRSTSIEKNAPIASENEMKTTGSSSKLSSGGSKSFSPNPKTISRSSRSKNPKPPSKSTSSSKGSK